VEPAIPIRYNSLGIGLTIDEGEVDVVITTGTEDAPIVVLMTPEVAAQIGAALMALATEATVLQGRVSELTLEELETYLTQVQRRNAAGLN
jgi:hypothetical protein